MVTAPFWDLVSRLNARRVLLWVCVLCLAVLTLSLIRNRSDTDDTFSLVPTSRTLPEPANATPDPDVTIPTRPAPTANPFASAFLSDLLERVERRRLEQEQARLKAQEPPPEQVEVKPPPVQGPPRPTAELLYRGMFTRPDGTVLGLIENQRSNRTAFHRVGDQIEGLTIGTISRGHLDLVLDGDVKVTLATGTPASFQPDK